MSDTRIAIALPALDAYSETFIAAHRERLREVVLVLSGGTPPQMADGRSLQLPTDLAGRARSFMERRLLGLDQHQCAIRRMAEVLRRRRVNVVLAEYGPMGEAMVEVCRLAGIPLVVHFHGYDAHMHAVIEQQGGYRRLFEAAASIVVVSRSMERRIVELGAPRSKVVYNCYGVDMEHFKAGTPETAKPHFLSIGRFVDKKAPALTLLAFRKVLDQRPEARLTMVGRGELWESCSQLVKALKMDEQVSLAGVLAPARIAELLRESRAFVQHSVLTSAGDSEGTPLAVLEAMASGVPVIATRHAGIADVVEEGDSGLLCAEGDVEAMAAAMVRLVDAPALAGQLGAAGRRAVEMHHRVEDSMARLQALLSGTVRA
jgi:glycosyltransferase involved in cell wall biosynthesis